MPAKYRLTRADFGSVRSFRRKHGAFFIVAYGTILGRTAPGGACVVSKKVAATSVARNRIKRLCRAVLSTFLSSCSSGVFVVTAKKGVLTATTQEIRHDLGVLLKEAHRAL